MVRMVANMPLAVGTPLKLLFLRSPYTSWKCTSAMKATAWLFVPPSALSPSLPPQPARTSAAAPATIPNFQTCILRVARGALIDKVRHCLQPMFHGCDRATQPGVVDGVRLLHGGGRAAGTPIAMYPWPATTRSEERRVGKECRSRWSPYH